MVVLVRASEGAAGALKGKGGRRRTKAVLATPPDLSPGNGRPADAEAASTGPETQDSEDQ